MFLFLNSILTEPVMLFCLGSHRTSMPVEHRTSISLFLQRTRPSVHHPETKESGEKATIQTRKRTFNPVIQRPSTLTTEPHHLLFSCQDYVHLSCLSSGAITRSCHKLWSLVTDSISYTLPAISATPVQLKVLGTHPCCCHQSVYLLHVCVCVCVCVCETAQIMWYVYILLITPGDLWENCSLSFLRKNFVARPVWCRWSTLVLFTRCAGWTLKTSRQVLALILV